MSFNLKLKKKIYKIKNFKLCVLGCITPTTSPRGKRSGRA